MPINAVVATIAVTDLDGLGAWYERLLGRHADEFPMTGVAEWHLTGDATLQLLHAPDRAGNAMVALVVDDIERQVRHLTERGFTTGEIDPEAEKARTASVTDPDGNVITFAELVEKPA